MEYTKQERAAPAAIAIVVHLALVYVFAAAIGVVPSPLPRRDLEMVVVPMEIVKPSPIEAPPELPQGETRDPQVFAPLVPPTLTIEGPSEALVGPIEPTIQSGGGSPMIDEAVISARLLRSSDPTYPIVSRAREEEGTVLVKVMISPYGTVGDAQIEKSSGFSRLDAAAIKAVRGWEFSAGKRGSQPIATWVTVSVKFVLNGR